MKGLWKIAVVVALIAAVGIVFALKYSGPLRTTAQAEEKSPGDDAAKKADDEPVKPLPRLVEVGSDMCIPCKEMKPIIDALAKDFAGRLKVEFVNVRTNPEAVKLYDIRVIPTQVFFDASGTEFFRHVGIFSREEILAKFKEQGIELAERQPEDTPAE